MKIVSSMPRSPNRKPLARTTHWRVYLAADGKALEIDRDDANNGIVIGLGDASELELLLAKAKGILELRANRSAARRPRTVNRNNSIARQSKR